jgi:hypothetical protein
MQFFSMLLVAYGVAFGLMNDKTPLSAWLRNLKFGTDEDGHTFFTRMLSCPYCTGFHAGWMAWLAVYLPDYLHGAVAPSAAIAGHVLVAAFAASAWCYFVDTAAQWLEDSAAAARHTLD